MPKFSVEVRGEDLEAAMQRLDSAPEIELHGSAGGWSEYLDATGTPPALEDLHAVVDGVWGPGEARKRVEEALDGAGEYTLEEPQLVGSRLTSVERRVLGGLMLPPYTPVTEKTAALTALRIGLEQKEVEATLRDLEQMDGPLVHRDTDATTGVEFWTALDQAIQAYEEGG